MKTKTIIFGILLLFSNFIFAGSPITPPSIDDFATSATDSRAYFDKAMSLIRDNNSKEAIICLNLAIRLDPKYVDAYVARASILEKAGNLQSALVDYTQALNIRPSDKIFYERGVIELSLKSFANAARDFTSAIELNPQFARAYSERGVAFLANDMLEEAKNDFIQAFQLNDKILFALEKIGEINIKQGNFTQALQNFNQLLQINPNDAKAYFNRGKVYEALNMPEQALKDYDIGASFNNNSPESEQKTLPENKLDPKINSNSI